MNSLVRQAYSEIFHKDPEFESKIIYSSAFKGFNAKVKYTKTFMEFRLSRKWKDVSDEIQIGLIQSLLNKIFKKKEKTMNIELYEIFMKKLQNFTKKVKTNPVLEEAFSKINEEYFNGLLMSPNLEFAGSNFHTLGTYDHGTDTIRISSVLKKDLHLLEYVLYHEMLHKKLKYKNTGNRTIHHSRQFKLLEKQFKDPEIEKKLNNFLKKEKLRKTFWFL